MGEPANTLVSLLAVGDSHFAGYRAKYQLPDHSTLANTQVMLEPAWLLGAYSVADLIISYDDGRQELNPILEDALRRWPGLNFKGKPQNPDTAVLKHLLLSIGTSAYVCDPLMRASDRFDHRVFFRDGVDFVLPDHPELPVDPGCKLLPVALIEDMFRSMFAQLRKMLTLLEPRYRNRLWIVGSPPPPEDNVKKLAIVKAKFAGGRPEEVSLPPPLVALKTWRLVNKLIAGICAESGCRFVDCAPVACDARGFLKREFDFDGFHGNVAYNELMVQHVVSAVLKAEFNADVEFARP